MPASHKLYFERAWPEVKLPESIALDRLDDARLDGIRALITARRDVFRSLDRQHIMTLRKFVPSVYWPSPSQIDPAEVENGFARLAPLAGP